MFSRSGSYELQVTGKYDQRSYYTFTPEPLCSLKDDDLPMDEQLRVLLLQVHRLLGIIEGMSKYIPDIDIFISMLMKKEAHLSCQIDGINAPFYDILDSYSEKSKNVADILNCMTAMQYAEGKTASNQLMREIKVLY